MAQHLGRADDAFAVCPPPCPDCAALLAEVQRLRDAVQNMGGCAQDAALYLEEGKLADVARKLLEIISNEAYQEAQP